MPPYLRIAATDEARELSPGGATYARANGAALRLISARRDLLGAPAGRPGHTHALARHSVARAAFTLAAAALEGIDPGGGAELVANTLAELEAIAAAGLIGVEQAPDWAFLPGGRPA